MKQNNEVVKQSQEVVPHVSRPDEVPVSVLGSAAGWERFERQSKYTVGGFYCTCPFLSIIQQSHMTTAMVPPCSPALPLRPLAPPACLVYVRAVLCPEMVNLLLDKAGFDVVKASSVPPGFRNQGSGENRGNIYYGRSVDLTRHITKPAYMHYQMGLGSGWCTTVLMCGCPV